MSCLDNCINNYVSPLTCEKIFQPEQEDAAGRHAGTES